MTYAHPRATWLDPNSGTLLDHAALMRRMAARQVVLLGETHDSAEIHRWQLQILTCLHLLRANIACGFEMFPRRVQPTLDAWVAGTLTTEAFLEQVEWNTVWGFPPEIYLPIFHFCRANAVPMLALNCNRPLVTRIGRDGWDGVREDEREGLTPAAPPTPGHRAYVASLIGKPPEEISDRFLRAQQVWDRAFACHIANAIQATPTPPLVVCIAGRGHIDYGHGTPHQLRSLGITNLGILLPTEAPTHDPTTIADIGDALFRLDHVAGS